MSKVGKGAEIRSQKAMGTCHQKPSLSASEAKDT